MTIPDKNHTWRTQNRTAQIHCCKDCPDRYVGCHANCDRYLAEKKALDDFNDRIKKKVREDAEATTFAINSYGTMKRGKGGKK